MGVGACTEVEKTALYSECVCSFEGESLPLSEGRGPKQIACYQVAGSSSLGEQRHITDLVVCVLGDFFYYGKRKIFAILIMLRAIIQWHLCYATVIPLSICKCFHPRKQN